MLPPIDILYEDNHIIAINKRSSDIVQADWTEDQPLLEKVREYIQEKYNKPGKAFIGIVHRIDRPVSGVILFGKTSKAVARLSEMFKDRKIKKTYWAVVKTKPNPASGTLIHYLKKNSERNKSYASDSEVPDSSRSWLDYRVVAESKKYYLIEVNPHTGRHHQIRVQLSTIGSIIKGDVKYGYDRPNDGGFIHLHARQIEFIHPISKKEIKIVAPVPNDVLWTYFEKEMMKTKEDSLES
jgi:23S rRNA pseudouridine1911/1915/1917 synthase